MDWKSRGGTYKIQVSRSADFSTELIEETTAAGIETYTITSPLSSDGTWFLESEGINSNNEEGAWSAIWSFTLDTTGPDAPTLNAPKTNQHGGNSHFFIGLLRLPQLPINSNMAQARMWNNYRSSIDNSGWIRSSISGTYGKKF
jgi:hypothetical protein